MVARTLLVVVSLLFASSTALADCTFNLNVVNKTGKKIKVDNVHYKLHKSSWEVLDFGAGIDLNNGQNSLQDKKNNKFHVWNAGASCPDARYRFKFTYNCYDDGSGPQTRHSNIIEPNRGAALATDAYARATVNNCSGDVTFD